MTRSASGPRSVRNAARLSGELVGHPAQVAVVGLPDPGVVVPGAVVDGDHLGADVGADGARGGGERPGQVGVRRGTPPRWPGVAEPSRTGANCLDDVERGAGAARRAVPARRPTSWPSTARRLACDAASSAAERVTESASVVTRTGSGPETAAIGHAAAELDRLDRRAGAVAADQPVEPADAGRRSRGRRPRPPPSPRSGSGSGRAARWRGRRPSCRRSTTAAAARGRGAGRRSRPWPAAGRTGTAIEGRAA